MKHILTLLLVDIAGLVDEIEDNFVFNRFAELVGVDVAAKFGQHHHHDALAAPLGVPDDPALASAGSKGFVGSHR